MDFLLLLFRLKRKFVQGWHKQVIGCSCSGFGSSMEGNYAPRFINPQFWGQSQPQLRCDLDGKHTKPSTLPCKFIMVGDPWWNW